MTFRLLESWKEARALAIAVYKQTDQEPLRRSWGLCDQMQRAAVSIPSNIAEGEDRGTNKDSLRFLYISKGSLAELRTQLDIAQASGRLNEADYLTLESKADHVGRLLGGMIRKRIERERTA
jgi:four helix bundle protein